MHHHSLELIEAYQTVFISIYLVSPLNILQLDSNSSWRAEMSEQPAYSYQAIAPRPPRNRRDYLCGRQAAYPDTWQEKSPSSSCDRDYTAYKTLTSASEREKDKYKDQKKSYREANELGHPELIVEDQRGRRRRYKSADNSQGLYHEDNLNVSEIKEARKYAKLTPSQHKKLVEPALDASLAIFQYVY